MKKLFAMFMAMAMMVTMTVTTFADGETKTGSITINGIGVVASDENASGFEPAATYTVYQILELETYSIEDDKYEYDLIPAWADFFSASGAGSKYIHFDQNGIFTWIAATDETTRAAFAQEALEYVRQQNEDTPGTIPVSKITTDSSHYSIIPGEDEDGEPFYSIKFSNLPLGYYLIDSDMGSLCGLTTTNPNASINAKNGAPTIDKQVKEDLTAQWGDTNSADIGQIVEFRTTIHVHSGAQNYVLHDTMEAGLSFKEDSVKVKVVDSKTEREETVAPTYTDENDEEKKNYEVITENTDGCTFQVAFSDDFCKTLKTNDRLIVYYNALLNRYAEIGNATQDNPLPNGNTTHLAYGEGYVTADDSTTTNTYRFHIVKTDGQNQLLDGAEFKIFSDAAGTQEVKVVQLLAADDITPIPDANGKPIYRRARADELGIESIKVEGGIIRLIGFDNGTYYLQETVNPSGYNKLETLQEFTISDNNLDARFDTDPVDSGKQIYSTGSGVQVVNYSGSMLPETGGTGTVMFITCGSVLVLACGLLLVTKKRMNMIQD